MLAGVFILVTTLVPRLGVAHDPFPEGREFPNNGPIQVIVSNPNEPLVFSPIDETACKVVEHLPGNYEYHLCSSENGNSVPICRFISMVAIVRVKDHDETFSVIEKVIGGAGSGHLTPFHYVQLWNHEGCTLIYADDDMKPTWNGGNTYMSDSNTIILAFHAGSIGLLKKIQDFPIFHPPTP